MMIEKNTNYAYKLKSIERPSFDIVRKLAVQFMMEIPQQLRDELYEDLNRGLEILDSEPQMTTYLYSFGQMHQSKLNYAFMCSLPEDFIEQPEINVIDYGCGQALGTMCYSDFLRKNGYSQRVKTITLIEPSEMCLKRAALHVSIFDPDAEIKTINKSFDELDKQDIHCDEDIPTLHILSNVLDMMSFDLDKFAELVKGCLKGYNQFVCVGPYLSFTDRDKRMDDFFSRMDGKEVYRETFDKYEFSSERAWTVKILCFSVGDSPYTKLSTTVTVKEIENGFEDECGVLYSKDGKKLLKCKLKNLASYSVKEGTKIICDDAFEECTSLRQIVVPITVIKIGESVFFNCSSLQQIIIPNSVTNIGESAFLDCKSLNKIVISDSITSIGNWTFKGCSSLNSVIIPDSVTNIGYEAFCDCIELQHIIIPNSVKSVGGNVFFGCSSLQQIIIPDSVTSIGAYAFCGCSSLRQIIISNSISCIECAVFAGCSSLQQIIIPELVTTINNGAFSACTSLRQIIMPCSVTNIGDDAFGYCSSLQQFTMPDSIKKIGEFVFFECTSLQQINIPQSIEYIGDNPFCCCDKVIVESCSSRFIVQKGLLIDIQDKKVISTLGNDISIIIPDSITHIRDWAFRGCSSLQQITFPLSVAYIGKNAFFDCNSLKKIIIPKDSMEKFKEMLDEKLWDKLVE